MRIDAEFVRDAESLTGLPKIGLLYDSRPGVRQEVIRLSHEEAMRLRNKLDSLIKALDRDPDYLTSTSTSHKWP